MRNVEPMFGSGVNWLAIRESIERVEYEGRRHRVAIAWKDGTRIELEMPLPNRRGLKGGDCEQEVGRVPRVSRLMALAIRYERLVQERTVLHYRDIAEAGQISRARMSQIMNLVDLAPEIQEALLFLPKTVAGPDHITEKALRPIARSMDWDQQKQQFVELVARAAR
jgi:hypothetical protein